MTSHTDNFLLSAVRSLEDVVIPAIDSNHPLAREQARTLSKYLDLLLTRLPYEADRARSELEEYCSMGDAILPIAKRVSPAIESALREQIAAAQELLSDPRSTTGARWARADELAGVISALVRTMSTQPVEDQVLVERIVLTGSEKIISGQRAWFLPQGWDTDADDVPELADAY